MTVFRMNTPFTSALWLFAFQANVNAIWDGRAPHSSRIFGPSPHLDQMTDGSLSPRRLALQNSPVDAVGGFTAKVGIKEGGELWLQALLRK